MNQPHVIGIDGGGSKTVGLLADLDKKIVARSEAGPSNFHAVGIAQAVEHVLQVVDALRGQTGSHTPAQCLSVVAGLAGLGRSNDRALMQQALMDAGFPLPLFLTHDAHIALLAGTRGEPGILLVSGTGSIAYGLDTDGREYRAGGWGPLLSDEGSGYAIGLSALRAVMRAHDGRGDATALTRAVLDIFGLESPERLVRWVDHASRSQIADLASLVCQAADQGDTVASSLLDTAASELASLANTVARQMGDSGSHQIILSGGVLKHQRIIVTRLRELLPHFALQQLQTEPVYGAVWLAIRRERHG